MSAIDKISRFATSAAQSVATLVRVALLSRPVAGHRREERTSDMVILGNGPSLRSFLDNHSDFLDGKDITAVNFFANTPEFRTIRPNHYILADPHFFGGSETDPNVASLWEALASASWPITLHLPAKMRRHPLAGRFKAASPLHTIATFNLTPAEGSGPLCRLLFRKRLAMPRPRNVMIPAIMEALHAGYRRIYLAGADHSWSRTLGVDEENRVVSVQPHFYSDNEHEKKRVTGEYSGYRLHDILRSLYVAFSSYHVISAYASTLGAEIINITPGSFIDAFPRLTLPCRH